MATQDNPTSLVNEFMDELLVTLQHAPVRRKFFLVKHRNAAQEIARYLIQLESLLMAVRVAEESKRVVTAEAKARRGSGRSRPERARGRWSAANAQVLRVAK
jgi:hypothetical protein